MKDQEFRLKAYVAGKAICQYLGHDKIARQSPTAPGPDQLHSRIATLATDNYARLKRHRDAILATTKKAEEGVTQFTVIRDRHGHLPFLLAAFALVYEYSIPFGWIECAFDSQTVKDAHMGLKTGKSSAARAGRHEATRRPSRRHGRGVTPKGSRESNVEISNINDLCVYANARFRNENPSNPEKVVFDCLFRNYVGKAFENAAIEWHNDHRHLGLTRERVVAEARAFVRSGPFRQYLPETHKSISKRIACHELVGARAWHFCQGRFWRGEGVLTGGPEDDCCISVAGDEIEERSVTLPGPHPVVPAIGRTPATGISTSAPSKAGRALSKDGPVGSSPTDPVQSYSWDDLLANEYCIEAPGLDPITDSLRPGSSPPAGWSNGFLCENAFDLPASV